MAAYTGPFPTVFTGSASEILISGPSFAGIGATSGTVTPNGIVVTNASTINGRIEDHATLLAGGITIADSKSLITGVPSVAIIITAPTFMGGVRNAGSLQGAITPE